ncbi:50S ribosomal protein L4 [Christensenella tenuis]|jgi:large subunit ribosomal protein L4|uniref:Large ribosomal subunit protein uL4 n=1 Tax=Christensenella tenuis TaxID=2763033 RepID=A0ABR7EFP4_9FIRM|nr:50S ribosomal protein L4 [Christensenella tenuis]MBC5648577.1 50S ribosomal protein L4 [Christensenella tenuis]
MPNVSVYKTDGKEAGKIELKDEVFGVEINKSVMHDAVVAHLANRRQGTQSALTRSEVRGGGIKPFRQKGTGRARQGTIRAPQMTHGGVVFAPKPRDYSMKLNKKVRALAMCCALSQKVLDEDIIVMEDLKMKAPKTKEMAAILKNLKAEKALIVTSGKDEDVVRAAANIQGVKTMPAATLSVYDILKYDKFIVTKDAVKAIEEVYA